MEKCNYLYRSETYVKEINQNYFSNKKLRFKILENATVLPFKIVGGASFGGIVDNKGNYIEESYVHHGIKDIYTPAEEIENIPNIVIYFGMLAHIWGHCITDNIKRIWFFKSETYRNYFKNLPIIYVPFGGGGIKA